MDSSNTVIFTQLCALAAELEGATVPPRVVTRLANGFDRALEKALAINFAGGFPDNAYIQRSIFRHAERGVRDFVP